MPAAAARKPECQSLELEQTSQCIPVVPSMRACLERHFIHSMHPIDMKPEVHLQRLPQVHTPRHFAGSQGEKLMLKCCTSKNLALIK
jgi:hypothetical protein